MVVFGCGVAPVSRLDMDDDRRKPAPHHFPRMRSSLLSRRPRASRRSFIVALLLITGAYITFFRETPSSHSDDTASGAGHRLSTRSVKKHWSSFLFGDKDPVIARGLVYDYDGLVRGWDRLLSYNHTQKAGLKKGELELLGRLKRRHPIEELVKRGVKQWETLLDRLSSHAKAFLALMVPLDSRDRSM